MGFIGKRSQDSLGYWLFYTQRSVAYAFAEVLKQCCLEHDKQYIVTPPQWGVLALLDDTDGLTIGTISQRRRVDAPTITGIVNRLEQNGLVERRHDREDRRVVKVFLTAEGRDILDCLISTAENFDDIMLRGLSQEDRRDLLVKLKILIANVSSVGPNSGERFELFADDL
jgi:DNA-binding MarR family transcriptional regulator